MKRTILLENPATDKQEYHSVIEKNQGKECADILWEAYITGEGLTFKVRRQYNIALSMHKKRNDFLYTPSKSKEIAPVNDKIFEPEKKEVIEDNDKSFIQLFSSMTNDPELLRIMRKCMTLYLYLAGNIQRKPRKDDSFNIYENYYKKGILAFAETEVELGRKTGMDRGTVSDYVNHMEKHGIIEIDKKMRINQKGIREHNIYILGTVEIRDDDRGTYDLFINKKRWKTPHNVLDKNQSVLDFTA